MPVHPQWKGYLKLSLVTCPVQMTAATSDEEKVRFHTLNRATGNRVVSQFVDAETSKPVDADHQAKGYERGEGDYLILEDDELESVALESTHTIDISTFAPRDSIEWVWLDTPYYLMPADKVGEEAFAVIREAMAVQKVVGISRLVLARRERAVLLEPRGKGIVLWAFRYGDEVRPESSYFEGVGDAAADSETLPLMAQIIKKQTRHWSTELVTDPVQAKLLDIIASRKKKPSRAKAKAVAPAPASDNVIDLMEVLRRSLQGRKGKHQRAPETD